MSWHGYRSRIPTLCCGLSRAGAVERTKIDASVDSAFPVGAHRMEIQREPDVMIRYLFRSRGPIGRHLVDGTVHLVTTARDAL